MQLEAKNISTHSQKKTTHKTSSYAPLPLVLLNKLVDGLALAPAVALVLSGIEEKSDAPPEPLAKEPKPPPPLVAPAAVGEHKSRR